MSWASRVALLAAVTISACAGPPRVPQVPDVARYANRRMWLCLPGRDDACSRDLSATALQPDGSLAPEAEEPATEPAADCFYVYPTVDLGVLPGNHDDFSDLGPMTDTTLAQVGRFRRACALYVPLYRQITIGTYLLAGDQLDARLELAYSDVEAAFLRYLAAFDRGRPIVLIGHSQGAHLVRLLIQRHFDHDPAMRARLLVALVIGGDVEVPRGKTVGATFDVVPLCTQPGQTACVVAYRSHEDGAEVSPGRGTPKPGNETACVDPADVTSSERRTFSGAYFPLNDKLRPHMRGVADVKTPFAALHAFYAGRCAEGPDGYRYLAVSLVGAPGDKRQNPVDFGEMPARKTLGLHILDFQIPQDDLIATVERAEKSAARVAALR
jgi:hypothetical protein